MEITRARLDASRLEGEGGGQRRLTGDYYRLLEITRDY